MQFIEKNKSSKTVLLINPPLYFSNGSPFALDVSVPPLGILYLASYIKKHSKIFTPIVIDMAVEKTTLNNIGLMIEEIKPFAIGITSMTPQLQGALELAEFIKKNSKKKETIFLGGPHISADQGFLTRFKGIFDYGITGEAEKTFLDSLNRLGLSQDIPEVQSGEVLMNLDDIPFPVRTLVNREKYSQYESLIFSRGCPYDCYYCSRPSISKKVRYRSASNLLKEIRQVYRFCKGKIDFQDDTFTIDKNRIKELCRRIIAEKLKLQWRCNTRIDLVDEELLRLMKMAGCELIHFGIESGNEKIREEVICKGKFTNKQILDTLRVCKKIKVKAAGYFMIGHPGESVSELEETKRMILTSGIDLVGVSIPTPFPGSQLYKIAKSQGIVDEKIIDAFAKKELGEGYSGNYPTYQPKEISKDYLFALLREVNRKFYLNYRMFFMKLKEDIVSFRKLKQDATDLFSLIIKGVSSRKPYVKT